MALIEKNTKPPKKEKKESENIRIKPQILKIENNNLTSN